MTPDQFHQFMEVVLSIRNTVAMLMWIGVVQCLILVVIAVVLTTFRGRPGD